FFSSRRRHTSFSRDWSSDVCSSDLVVAGGVAHVFQVVVLAAGAQASLHRGRAHVGALVCAEEHVLELDHARVGEHERGVIARHQRAGRHYGVALGGEEVQEGLANVGNGSNCGDGAGHGGLVEVLSIWNGLALGKRRTPYFPTCWTHTAR